MAAEDTIRKVMEAINDHDADAFAALWASDVVVYAPDAPEPLNGRDAVRENMEGFFHAFPDVKVEVLSILSQGGTTATEMLFTGTNTGPMEGPQGTIPATNKSIELRGSGFQTVNSEGLITEERRYYDTASMMGQLGLIPES